MGWMNMLYRTYEANSRMAGVSGQGKPLVPVAHTVAKAQVEITVDLNGHFAGAAVIPDSIKMTKIYGDKEKAYDIANPEAQTIIPITESSAARANAPAPHALCDKLPYIASDLPGYLTDKKKIKTAGEKFGLYITALKKWADSPYCTPKVAAVYGYLSTGSPTADLIACGIISTDTGGKLSANKISKTAPDDIFVRFRVMGTEPDAVWLDKDMFSAYTQFYLSGISGRTDVCYVSGKNEPFCTLHPKGIVSSDYGAKLISANDSSNFVFRGRFETSGQASSVSYEVSQKVHAALTWLAANQGVEIGSTVKRTYVFWNPEGKPVADPDELPGTVDTEVRALTEPEYRKYVLETFAGYRNRLDDNDDIVVIALEAATTGRLSVVYYNELKNSDYYDRIQRWYETCTWYVTKFTPDGKPYKTVCTPPVKQIINCAFVTERGNFLETDDRILKQHTQRILHCMLDREPFPRDIMQRLTANASTPLAYTAGNRGRIMSAACAAIKKYYNDKYGREVITMILDENNSDRSYLFGRLLAVAEQVERLSYDRGSDRDPAAIRLQSAFVHHPMRTWETIYRSLTPYFGKLTPGSREYFRGMIADITSKLHEEDVPALNHPLNEMYLIGYELQRNALRKKKDTPATEEPITTDEI